MLTQRIYPVPYPFLTNNEYVFFTAYLPMGLELIFFVDSLFE
jgi:hypothetical protein